MSSRRGLKLYHLLPHCRRAVKRKRAAKPLNPSHSFITAEDVSNIYGNLDSSSNHIRLLRIYPSLDLAAPVVCELRATKLKDTQRPIYKALSYAWGDSCMTSPIVINGKTLEIPANLAAALRYIRHERQDVMLWVDALCINQANLLERNYQVSFMGSIYSEAEEVLGWLGEGSEKDELSFRLIRQWGEWVRYRKSVKFTISDVEGHVPSAFDETAVQATERLAKFAYWTRIWVVQELVLAKQAFIICGRQKISLTTLQAAWLAWVMFLLHSGVELGDQRAMLYERLYNTPLDHMMDLVKIFKPVANLKGDPSTIQPGFNLDILIQLSRLDSSDPRDKVYGTLGILPPGSGLDVMPDYSRSAEDIFTEIAKALILKESSLSTISYAAHLPSLRGTGSLRLPSWVPDLVEGSRYYVPLERLIGGGLPASQLPFEQVVRVDVDNRVLYCKGYVFDSVVETYAGLFLPRGCDPESAKSLHESVVDGPPVSGTPVLRALFDAVLTDACVGQGIPCHRMYENSSEFLNDAAGFLRSVLEKRCIEENTTAEQLVHAFVGDDESLMARELIRRIKDPKFCIKDYTCYTEAVLCERVPFRTSNNVMGIGAIQMAPGDLVCHLLAHKFAFVLRPEAGYYSVVGECFLSGFKLPKVEIDKIPSMHEFKIC